MKLFNSLLLFTFSLTVSAQGLIQPQTNLGSDGNDNVVQRFGRYQKQGGICAAPRQGVSRILLTGFGPFSGSNQNISGEVVKAFGSFTVPFYDVDAVGVTRDLNIDGIDYQICFMVLSTAWDLSAAIVIAEAQQFQANFILMTGVGTQRLLFETGNSNQALFMGGYDIHGNSVSSNYPEENYVLPPTDPNVPVISNLTWDAYSAKAAVEADVQNLGFESFIPAAGYPQNNYVCNNIAFVVTHAAKNFKTELAGGQLTLYPAFAVTPKIGFLHYPSGSSTASKSLQQWSMIVGKIIKSQLPY